MRDRTNINGEINIAQPLVMQTLVSSVGKAGWLHVGKQWEERNPAHQEPMEPNAQLEPWEGGGPCAESVQVAWSHGRSGGLEWGSASKCLPVHLANKGLRSGHLQTRSPPGPEWELRKCWVWNRD